MNIRITDLLDNYFDESSRLLPPDQVLAPDQKHKQPVPPPPVQKHRMKKPLLIAAALILAFCALFAGAFQLSVRDSGTSLSPASAISPAIPSMAPPSVSPQPSLEASSTPEETAVEAQLDDTNSVIVTSAATGLTIRVPTAYQDGLVTDEPSIPMYSNLTQESMQYDAIFSFYDTSNTDTGGLVYLIMATDADDLSSYVADSLGSMTFEINVAFLGKKEDTYYTMLQFGISALEPTMFQFDTQSLTSTSAYYKRLQCVIPMIRSFIERNQLEAVETNTDSWDDLFAQRMLEPTEEIIQKLSKAEAAEDFDQGIPSDSIEPTEESLLVAATGPAADLDGDGLLTAALSIPIETDYGTVTLYRFELDLDTQQYKWYVDTSELVGPFLFYDSLQDGASDPDFMKAITALGNAVEGALNGMLVYKNGSYTFVDHGEITGYADATFTLYDYLWMDSQAAIPGNPGCLQLNGTTYPLS